MKFDLFKAILKSCYISLLGPANFRKTVQALGKKPVVIYLTLLSI